MNKNLTLKMAQTLAKIDSKTTITNKAYRNRVEPVKELSMGRRYNGNCRQVICLDTLEIFPSETELAKKLNIDVRNVSFFMRRDGKHKGYTYCFADEWNQSKAEITNKFNSSNKNKKTIVKKGESIQFDFYKVKYNKITDKKVHGNAHSVLCLETFERFPSMTALAKKLKISECVVSTYIRQNKLVCGRRYIDLSKTQYHQNDIIDAGLEVVKMAKEVIKAVQKAGYDTKTLKLAAETKEAIKRMEDNQ